MKKIAFVLLVTVVGIVGTIGTTIHAQSTCPIQSKINDCEGDGLLACYTGGSSCECSRQCPQNPTLWNSGNNNQIKQEPQVSPPTLLDPCKKRSSAQSSGFVRGDNPSPWGSRCAIEINNQISKQKRMFYDSCMSGGGCSRFDWQCRTSRQRFCTDWGNYYEKNPQPASCDLAKTCQPPSGTSLDDWLNGTPQIGRAKPHLSFILRSICIQYFQVKNNKNGQSAVGCTRDELNRELARYYPQCKESRPKD